MVRLFAVIDRGPFVTDTEIVREAIMVGEAVICCCVSRLSLRGCLGISRTDRIRRRI